MDQHQHPRSASPLDVLVAAKLTGPTFSAAMDPLTAFDPSLSSGTTASDLSSFMDSLAAQHTQQQTAHSSSPSPAPGTSPERRASISLQHQPTLVSASSSSSPFVHPFAPLQASQLNPNAPSQQQQQQQTVVSLAATTPSTAAHSPFLALGAPTSSSSVGMSPMTAPGTNGAHASPLLVNALDRARRASLPAAAHAHQPTMQQQQHAFTLDVSPPQQMHSPQMHQMGFTLAASPQPVESPFGTAPGSEAGRPRSLSTPFVGGQVSALGMLVPPQQQQQMPPQSQPQHHVVHLPPANDQSGNFNFLFNPEMQMGMVHDVLPSPAMTNGNPSPAVGGMAMMQQQQQQQQHALAAHMASLNQVMSNESASHSDGSEGDTFMSPSSGGSGGPARKKKKRSNGKTGEFACDHPGCGKIFQRMHNLKSHTLTHSDDKPYKCPACALTFRRNHDLRRHSRLHTGNKPHTCMRCSKSFARADALRRHLKVEACVSSVVMPLGQPSAQMQANMSNVAAAAAASAAAAMAAHRSQDGMYSSDGRRPSSGGMVPMQMQMHPGVDMPGQGQQPDQQMVQAMYADAAEMQRRGSVQGVVQMTQAQLANGQFVQVQLAPNAVQQPQQQHGHVVFYHQQQAPQDGVAYPSPNVHAPPHLYQQQLQQPLEVSQQPFMSISTPQQQSA